jgi:hypothetical protein
MCLGDMSVRSLAARSTVMSPSSQASLHDHSVTVLLSLQWMQNGIRELQPFGRHLAVKGALFLVFGRRHHVQTVSCVTCVFFVLAALGNFHDTPLVRRLTKSLATA